MKNVFIALCLIISFVQISFAINDQETKKIIQSPIKYLRKIEDLKNTHKIPKLIIKSIINKTRFDFVIIEDFSSQQYLLKSGCEFTNKEFFFMFDNQRKISRDERLQGICSQFNFFIVESVEFETVLSKNSGYCSVNLFVELTDNDDISLQSIDEMFVMLFITYFENGGYAWDNVDLKNCESNEFNIGIEIFEFNASDFEGKAEFKFLCKISELGLKA